MWMRFLFRASLLIPMLGLLSYPPETMALLYSFFGLVFVFRKDALKLYKHANTARKILAGFIKPYSFLKICQCMRARARSSGLALTSVTVAGDSGAPP